MGFSSEEKNKIRKDYLQLVPHLKKAKKRLVGIIAEVASQIQDKSLVRARVIGTRIKSFDSLLRKAEQKGLGVEDTFHGIHDLVGIRVVCNNVDDVYRFYELLIKSLPVEDVINKEDFLATPKPSGYRAFHINIYVDVGEPFSPQRIPCEIQIRTLLQDSWAELTHEDIYKADVNLPEDLKGRMEDLASLLAVADEIAQSVRHRIGRDFQVGGPVDLGRVSRDGLAYIFKQTFGTPPSDYIVREAEQLCEQNGLESLSEVERILGKKKFRERVRKVYVDKTGFGFSPEPELIFMAAVKAAVQNEQAAYRYIKARAREEREEIDTYWRNEVLGQLPDTFDEFMERVKNESLDVEEIAEAWGIADSCAICGTRIVDPDTFAAEVADYYGVDDYSEIFGELIGLTAGWGEDGLCSYHAYYAEKDT